eukprot:8175215-Alexandrium_andersonii.AAC.1
MLRLLWGCTTRASNARSKFVPSMNAGATRVKVVCRLHDFGLARIRARTGPRELRRAPVRSELLQKDM